MLRAEHPVGAPVELPVSPAEVRDGTAWDPVRAAARIAELEAALRELQAHSLYWKRESIQARKDLNGLRGIFESNRRKLAEARADLKDLQRSRSARHVRRLEKDVARLRGLLDAAGVMSGRSSMMELR